MMIVSSALPLVTVITATYQAGRTLPDTLASLERQSFRQFEHIVIDGGSTDGTLELLRSSKGLTWISEPDGGVYDAWNKGLALARGTYIAFLGADDTYHPEALKAYASFAERASHLDYISSQIAYGTRVLGEPWEWRKFRRFMNVAHVGSWHSRRLFEQLGVFDPSYKITGDYELLLRAGDKLKAGFLPEITAEMGRGGVSSGRSGAVFVENMRAKLRHETVSPATAFFDYVVAKMKHRTRARFLGGGS